MKKVGMGVLVLLFTSYLYATPIQWKIEVGGNGHWYEVISSVEPISWTESKVFAETRGGYLTTITSAEENNFVFNLADNATYWRIYYSHYSLGPWIGGFQSNSNYEPLGGWAWISGEVFTYSNWMPDQPDNALWNGQYENYISYVHYNITNTGSRYIDVNGITRSSKWNDSSDTRGEIYSYVVEYNIPEPASIALLTLGSLILSKRKTN